jgi:histidinol-phosphate phosphatase family protein
LNNSTDKAVFLDRDGTIARDVHYCRRPEDFELLPTVPEAIRLLAENGFKVVVITNQSGIARGYFTEETLARIHDKMRSELAEHNARVDAIYYCPHHPDERCSCRKPGTALFCEAAREHRIDLQSSYVVGDMQMDIDAGKALGATTVLVTTGPQSSAPNLQSPMDPPDYVAPDLLRAAKWILLHSRQITPDAGPTMRIKRRREAETG